MQLSLKSFAAGAAVMLVLGAGSAVAATGAGVIIGEHNTARTTTVITDTRGTPLSLRAPTSAAPLAVSNDKLVKHLNADYLDGVSGGGFLRRARAATFALKSGGSAEYYATIAPKAVDFNNDGKNDSMLSAIACPTGTVATGVSVYNAGNVGIEDAEVVDINKDGRADTGVVIGAGLTATSTTFGAIVDCYNPRGKVPAQTVAPGTAAVQAQRQAATDRVRSLAAAALTR